MKLRSIFLIEPLYTYADEIEKSRVKSMESGIEETRAK